MPDPQNNAALGRKTPFHSAPDAASRQLGVLAKGAEVRVLRVEESWTQVEAPDADFDLFVPASAVAVEETRAVVRDRRVLLLDAPSETGVTVCAARKGDTLEVRGYAPGGFLRVRAPADAAVWAPSAALAKKGGWFELAEIIAVALVLAVLLRHYVTEPFRIPSSSMEPTLIGDPNYGDRILAEKWSCKPFFGVPFDRIRPWDVVVFKHPFNDKAYIKRSAFTADGDAEDVAAPGSGERFRVCRAICLIQGGDLFIREAGGPLVIHRKPLDLQEDLWHPLYQSAFNVGSIPQQSYWKLSPPDAPSGWSMERGALMGRASSGKTEETVFLRPLTNLYIKNQRRRFMCTHAENGESPAAFLENISTAKHWVLCPYHNKVNAYQISNSNRYADYLDSSGRTDDALAATMDGHTVLSGDDGMIFIRPPDNMAQIGENSAGDRRNPAARINPAAGAKQAFDGYGNEYEPANDVFPAFGVADLRVDIDLAERSGTGTLTMRLTRIELDQKGREPEFCQLEAPLAGGPIRVRRHTNISASPAGDGAAGTWEDELIETGQVLPAPGPVKIGFAHYDQRLVLWLNGRRVWGRDYDRPPFGRSEGRVSLAVDGGEVRIPSVRISRDLYYIPDLLTGITQKFEDDYLKQFKHRAGSGFQDDCGDKYALDVRASVARTFHIDLLGWKSGERLSFRLHEGFLWMLGDNQPSSADSRDFGAVKVDRVVGRAVTTFWPPNRWGRIRGRE
jgi:hypothetical protein